MEFPRHPKSSIKLRLSCLIFCPVLLVSACTSILQNVQIIEKSDTQRKMIGKLLQSRLEEHKDLKPIFSNKGSRLSSAELSVINEFSKTLPNGSFIFSGNPTYIFYITKKIEKEQNLENIRKITYSIQLLDAESKKSIASSEAVAHCNTSQALITYPMNCSSRTPALLREGLEKL